MRVGRRLIDLTGGSLCLGFELLDATDIRIVRPSGTRLLGRGLRRRQLHFGRQDQRRALAIVDAIGVLLAGVAGDQAENLPERLVALFRPCRAGLHYRSDQEKDARGAGDRARGAKNSRSHSRPVLEKIPPGAAEGGPLQDA